MDVPEKREVTSSPSHPSTDASSGQQSFWKELLKIFLIALIVVAPIRAFIAQPFVVSGSSMVPTFDDGDYLIVDQLSYELDSPERLDVVVFKYPKHPQTFFIKRIIGLPGETITIDNGQIEIANESNPEGFILEEPYVDEFSFESLSITLSEDEYFVLGDNRQKSSDSRVWGPLDKSFIVGRAFVRLLPLDQISVLPGDVSD